MATNFRVTGADLDTLFELRGSTTKRANVALRTITSDSTATGAEFDSFTSVSWIVVSAGSTHIAAIRSDYKLFTWGLGAHGRLGDGATITRSSPVQIGTSSWTAVSAGGAFTTAIRSDYA